MTIHTAESSDEERFSAPPASKEANGDRSVERRLTQYIGDCTAVYLIALDCLVSIQVTYDALQIHAQITALCCLISTQAAYGPLQLHTQPIALHCLIGIQVTYDQSINQSIMQLVTHHMSI